MRVSSMLLVVLLCLTIFACRASAADRCGEKWGQITSRFIDETYPLLDALPPVDLPLPGSTDRVAVLVEPREDPCIRYVVKNILHFLDENWQLQIMHGRDNLEYIKDELRDHVDLDRVTFTSFYHIVMQIDSERPFPDWISSKWDTMWKEDLNPKILKTGKWNINREVYSQGLLVPWFWEPITAEHILIFQTDSWLCDFGLEEYLNYDYIGAMWRMCDYGEDHIFWGHCMGGNGGLSLRKRSLMLSLTKEQKRSTINEDYQFALWFKKVGNVKVTPLELRREIFSEELQPKIRSTPYGIHKIWHYQNPYAVGQILKDCMNPLRHPDKPAVEQPKVEITKHDEL